MTLATVSSTVEPLIATPLTLFAMPPVLTVKAEVAAVVEESGSSYVRTTLVPLVLVAAEEKVGGAITTAYWWCAPILLFRLRSRLESQLIRSGSSARFDTGSPKQALIEF